MTVGDIGLMQKFKSTVMKPTNTIISLALCFFCIRTSAQDILATNTSEQTTPGKWNEYNAATGTLTQINPVTLDSYGNLEKVKWSFNEKPATQKDIQKNILKLETDLFK